MFAHRALTPLRFAALLLLAALTALALAEPQFVFKGESHHAFGRALGTRFAPQIRERVQRSVKLQGLLLPFHATPNGQQLYAQYLDTHTTVFPVRGLPVVSRLSGRSGVANGERAAGTGLCRRAPRHRGGQRCSL